jgi:predicted ATP-grasp superfamily ATP-dependent carboligase
VGADDLRILVYEYASGGGLAEEALRPDVLCEGFSMLRAFSSDLKNAGHEVVTLLDARLAAFSPPLNVDQIASVSLKETLEPTLLALSKSADAVFIIAPETNNTLSALVEMVEEAGAFTLNCAANMISKVSEKPRLHTYLTQKGIATPETLVFHVQDNVEAIFKEAQEKLGLPLLFKPADSVSCHGISIVQTIKQANKALEQIRKASANPHFLVQKFIKGIPASVSLLVEGREAIPISINRQYVTITTSGRGSSYMGGYTPLQVPDEKKVFITVKKVATAFRLRGIIGIDLIMTDEEPVVVEVNPRLTTSYVGIRHTIQVNIAKAVVDLFWKNQLPTHIPASGVAHFQKVNVAKTSANLFLNTDDGVEVVSPPFAFPEADHACMLLSAWGKKHIEARRKLREAKKRLLNTM